MFYHVNRSNRVAAWSSLLFMGLLFYVLSSGPVLAVACWLREHTHIDQFYAVFWLYFPLWAFGRIPVLDAYVGWWFKLLGAVGPG